MKLNRIAVAVLVAASLYSCQQATEKQTKTGTEKSEAVSVIKAETRIVSLNGTLTEIIAAAGFTKNLVGTDQTSTFPAEVANLPKVGHNRNISPEGILSLSPNLVIGKKEDMKPEVLQQLQQAGIRTMLFDQDYSVEGTKALISQFSDSVGAAGSVTSLAKTIDQDLTQLKPFRAKPKVLFIYARGAGTLMVAGGKTQMQKLIELAGGENAAQGFDDFKPLTPEALVTANPDVIMLFDSGLESLNGPGGLKQVPGIGSTKAGRAGAFISMDGQLVSGFGPRLGKAVLELNKKLHAVAGNAKS